MGITRRDEILNFPQMGGKYEYHFTTKVKLFFLQYY